MTDTNDLIICPHCGKSFSKYGIKNHISIVHHGNYSQVSHNKGKKRNKPAWNKGLTKDTNEIVAKMAKDASKRLTGKKGKKHSEETKEKISKARLKYLMENPDKVPYKLNHSSKKSYPEILFEKALISSNITGWEYGYQHGIYEYDFAFVHEKIDVEIDGGTHNTEKVKKIDARRDAFSISKGWRVIRFTDKEVKTDIIKCINKLKNLLEETSPPDGSRTHF